MLAGFRHSVDHKGAVVFTLPGGGVIRDQGKELFFSARDEAARDIALLYARKKWGRHLVMEKGRIVFQPGREMERSAPQPEPNGGKPFRGSGIKTTPVRNTYSAPSEKARQGRQGVYDFWDGSRLAGMQGSWIE